MHELGLCSEMVHTLEELMDKEHLTEIHSVTVQIGEVTGVLPRYMMECWPAAIEGTRLDGSELKIDWVNAKGMCRHCDTEFLVSQNKGHCPKCGSEDYDLETGFEFEITEIHGK